MFVPGAPTIVMDASVGFDVLQDDPRWVDRWVDWQDRAAMVCAPPHFRLEIANALLRIKDDPALIARRITKVFEAGVEVIDQRLDDLLDTLHLAQAHGLTAYDAAYLQLALSLEAELATQDRALARAARAEGLIVHE